MIDIRMPRLSDTMEEGAIAVWRKKPGDQVDVGDILVEIETDKATMEYEAYDAGILRDILVPEGQQATIGTVIAHLDDGSTEQAADAATAVETPQRPADANEQDERPSVDATMVAGERRFASPLVRRLAREAGMELAQVTGSGPGGRIVRADLEHVLARKTPAPATPDAAANEVRPVAEPATIADARRSTAVAFDATRQAISRRLTESSSGTPHFTMTSVASGIRGWCPRCSRSMRRRCRFPRSKCRAR